jgi:hypothetical protein
LHENGDTRECFSLDISMALGSPLREMEKFCGNPWASHELWMGDIKRVKLFSFNSIRICNFPRDKLVIKYN